jgi:Tfp pilus assembly protein PilV
MQNATMEAPRRRPLGDSMIAVLVAIQGIIFLILGILALAAVIAATNSAGMTVNGYAITGATVSIVAGVFSGVFLVVGLVSLLFV